MLLEVHRPGLRLLRQLQLIGSGARGGLVPPGRPRPAGVTGCR
ncbi:hypothetical protein [Amycolatopsis rifamycinica]|nr:hypothetical protein [Amycolatopsis rifamycinica]